MPYRLSSFTIPTIPSFLSARRCCCQWISANANKFHDNKIYYYLILLSAHIRTHISVSFLALYDVCEIDVWNGPLAIIFIWNTCVRASFYLSYSISCSKIHTTLTSTYMWVLCTYLICMDFCLCVARLRLLFKVNIWVQWIINIVDYYNDKFSPFSCSRLSCVSVFLKLRAIKYKNNNRKSNRIVQIISHFITPVLLNAQISGFKTNIAMLKWRTSSSRINSIEKNVNKSSNIYYSCVDTLWNEKLHFENSSRKVQLEFKWRRKRDWNLVHGCWIHTKNLWIFFGNFVCSISCL